ncbi:RDD family protein [Sphaerisporangium sp. NPDC005288]|uniref:RDD family protein n=1 Tax=Sphaerisporangium sp. NPDC005288 TaxID=3155114 RepID=UPI0033ADB4CB
MTAEPPPGGYDPQGPGQPYGNPQGGGYGAPQGGYGAPQGGYDAPQGGYGAPQSGYGAPQGYNAPYGGPQGAPLPPGAPAPLAEWWERWVARIIDMLIFGVVYFILNLILSPMFAPSTEEILANPGVAIGSSFVPGLVSAIIAYGAYAAYDYVLHSKDGQTIGKKVMKIRLVGVGGAPVDSSALMKRSAIYPGVLVLYGIPFLGVLSGIFVLVLGVLILTDKPLQQGLHDKLAGTVVVKAPR